MNRRQFLTATTTAGAFGLLAGCMNSDPGEDSSTTDEQTPTEAERTTSHEPTTENGEPANKRTRTETGIENDSCASGKMMDGVEFEFRGDGPECSGAAEMRRIDQAGVEFETNTDEIIVEGVISGSDLCSRARLADLSYDREESHLSVAIESVKDENCEAGGQCIVEIPYEGTFSFENGVPESVSVSHNGRDIMSGAHESARVTPPDETTDE
ncbi:twin-arginine translocation signal domain-containing protein [Halorhabdus rudnickae]|uniref:twin-arginine translocation signal domain-containing protein n=1 Tax=Halorhabdus rudnickae TaxID=1775544 RepID=UPI001082ABDA|nr:twin-arginine translocation signal domain-containing protein [Halorhabdus rudnickae]